MKKTLLSLTLVATGFWSFAQVVVSGVSPAAIQGSYEFRTQANSSAWPNPATGAPYTDDGTWGAIPYDFNVNGTFIMDTLMLIEDGTPGMNPQGNPMSQEGCNPATNDLTGKIAVIYRNTCDFSSKIYNAQVAGAIAAIIVNREDEVIGMSADATGDGPNVTIPAVFISSSAGSLLINEMNNGPVVMFIGNKVGVFADDMGASSSEALISPYGGANSMMNNGFNLGIQVYNYGTNTQSSATVNATITGPSGVVYDETVNLPSVDTGDTVSIFNGNTEEFPPFTLATYDNGDYTLTYTIDIGVADESDFDNVHVSTFKINDNVLSLSRIDGAEMPIATTFNAAADYSEYQSCMFYLNEQTDFGLTGVSFVPNADTSINNLEGAEILVNIYEWNDTWTDLDDASYFGTGATNDAFANRNLVAFEAHYPMSNDETNVAVTVPFTPMALLNGQRYLVCLQSFDPAVRFGYDNNLNYDGNQGINRMPISPIFSEDPLNSGWFIGGWSNSSAPSIALNVIDPATLSLNDESVVNGKAYPNPATNDVTIALEAAGNGNLTVTDISGKVVKTERVSLVNGNASVNIESLESGLYIFNVALENGQTSQFNVVKN